MNKTGKKNGFSLTEVLIATAILAIGLMMIAMVFPVGVKLTTLAAERTVGTVAANEAFAIFRLYSQDPDGVGVVFTGIDCAKIPDTNSVSLPEIVASMPNTSFLKKLNSDALLNYPSIPGEAGKYHWSLLARRTDVNELQLTAFVSRRMEDSAYYRVDYINDTLNNDVWPQPVRFNCSFAIAVPEKAKELKINVTPHFTIQDVDKFVIEGATIVDDRLGVIYRVVERKDTDLPADGIREILLDKDWQEDLTATVFERGNPRIWLIPPAVGSSRNPCIFVQQRTIGF